MLTTLFYPSFLLTLFIIVLLLIPKELFKEYFIYGVLIGGLGDIIVVGLFQNLFHIIQFTNVGLFNVLGMNILSPPCWILMVMLFLRFLPRKRSFLIIYNIAFASFSVGFGYIVYNANLFTFRPWFYPFFSFITFLGWWVFATFLFLRTSPLAKTNLS
jgi:hypothetical protein